MEWPFPVAKTVPSLRSSDTRISSTVEAYASVDRTFAEHFERDDHLRDVYSSLLLNDLPVNEEINNPSVKSAKLSILRGLLTRADFAAEQKLQFFVKWEKLTEQERCHLQDDATEVNNEVRNTLLVLREFGSMFSPDLDMPLETLERLLQTPLSGAAACIESDTDDETDCEPKTTICN
jgi:hypothetical protein